MDIFYSLSGLLVGVLVGMTGVGGGALMTPILVLLFGFNPVTAIGTDLWFAAITKLVGGTLHARTDSVDWQVVRRLSLGSIPAAIICLVILSQWPADKTLGHSLTQFLAIALLVSAAAMLIKSRLHRIGRQMRIDVPVAFKRAQGPLTVLAGALLGVLVSLTSVGAGSLCAVMLLYLYPLRMSAARIVGTDIVHAVPLALVAGIGHLWLGNVNLPLLGYLLLGSIPGVIIGTKLTTKMPESWLRTALALMLIAVAIKLLR